MWKNENRACYDRSLLRYPRDLTDWGWDRVVLGKARSCARRSWRGPAGGRPARVRGGARTLASVASYIRIYEGAEASARCREEPSAPWAFALCHVRSAAQAGAPRPAAWATGARERKAKSYTRGGFARSFNRRWVSRALVWRRRLFRDAHHVASRERIRRTVDDPIGRRETASRLRRRFRGFARA